MENRSNLHHLVLGQLKDFLTQTELTDTHDERYRQKIAKHLASKGKFDKRQFGLIFIYTDSGEKI